MAKKSSKTIYDELSAATSVTRNPGEDTTAFLVRLTEEVSKLSDEAYDKLSSAAQTWFNSSGEAINVGKMDKIPALPGLLEDASATEQEVDVPTVAQPKAKKEKTMTTAKTTKKVTSKKGAKKVTTTTQPKVEKQKKPVAAKSGSVRAGTKRAKLIELLKKGVTANQIAKTMSWSSANVGHALYCLRTQVGLNIETKEKGVLQIKG